MSYETYVQIMWNSGLQNFIVSERDWHRTQQIREKPKPAKVKA